MKSLAGRVRVLPVVAAVLGGRPRAYLSRLERPSLAGVALGPLIAGLSSSDEV